VGRAPPGDGPPVVGPPAMAEPAGRSSWRSATT